MCISLVALLCAKSHFFMHETPQSTNTFTHTHFNSLWSRSHHDLTGWLANWLDGAVAVAVASIWRLLWFIVVRFKLVNSDTKKRSCCFFIIIIIHYLFRVLFLVCAQKFTWLCIEQFSVLVCCFHLRWHFFVENCGTNHSECTFLTFKYKRVYFYFRHKVLTRHIFSFSFVIRVSPVSTQKEWFAYFKYYADAVTLRLLFCFGCFHSNSNFAHYQWECVCCAVLCHAQSTMNGTFLRSEWLCECVFFSSLLLLFCMHN